jgi:hypothetical protein
MTYEHTSKIICFTLIFENLLHPFLDLLEKIYLDWNIVGGASATPPVPYVSSGFVTSTVEIIQGMFSEDGNIIRSQSIKKINFFYF